MAAGTGRRWPPGRLRSAGRLASRRACPRSWAFTVWVLLYVLQGAGTVYQLLPHGYEADGFAKKRIVNSISAPARPSVLEPLGRPR